VSKVFEHCILRRFSDFLNTHDSQFGFKKIHEMFSCNLLCIRNIVNHYVTNGSTVNLCALDITKAFDRMYHHGLFVKLMRPHVPVTLLTVLEYWLNNFAFDVRDDSYGQRLSLYQVHKGLQYCH